MSMINKSENWAMTGEGYELLKTMLTDFADVTKSAKIKASELTLWTKKDESYYYSHKKNQRGSAPTAENSTLFGWNKKVYDLASNAIPALGVRLDLTGEGLLHASWSRDHFLQELIDANKNSLTMITRFDNKVFGVFSEKYTYIPQTELLKIVDEAILDIGNSTINFWADHWKTVIHLRFKEKAEELSDAYGLPDTIIPGIIISTSDTSDSSISISETWETKEGMLIGKKVSRKHMGNANIADVIENMKKTIFAGYKYVPEKMAELLTIDIKSIDSEHIFKKLKADKILGSKRMKELCGQIDLEINGVPHLTAYGVVIRMMSVPDRVSGFSELQKQLLQEALWGLLEYNFTASTAVVLM